MSEHVYRKTFAPRGVGTTKNGKAIEDDPIVVNVKDDPQPDESSDYDNPHGALKLGDDGPRKRRPRRKVYEPKIKRAQKLPDDEEISVWAGKTLREEFAELLYGKAESAQVVEDASYPEITMIRPYCVLAHESVWVTCQTVANLALVKRGNPSEFTNLLNGQPISTFYMAALALAYSVYQTTEGQLPTLLMNPPVINDLLTAVLPTTKGGIFYEFEVRIPFDTLLLNLSLNFPYASVINPQITIAPFTGLDDPQGRATINNVIPAVTIADIESVGGEAWETILQWLFGQHYADLLQRFDSQTNYSKNVSAFSFFRLAGSDTFRNVAVAANEVAIPARDNWLTALQLNDLVAWVNREAWNNRTLISGTHEFAMALLYGHRGKGNYRTETPMINFSTVVAQALIGLGAGEIILVNATPDGNPNFPGDGPTSIMTTGEFLTALLMAFSRRYALYSAMYTGSRSPDPLAILIGSGSRFITTMNSDQIICPQNLIEDLANMMLNREPAGGLVQLPYPMVRGTKVTIDPITPSVTNNLVPLYGAVEEWTQQYLDWAFVAAGVNDLPDSIDLATVGYSFTSGMNTKQAILNMNSAHQMIQAFMHTGNAVGNDNELFSKNLHITHIFGDEPRPVQGIDITVGMEVEFFSSSVPIDQRKVCNFLQGLFPVFYLRPDQQPAYQAIYKQFISANVDQIYARYRLSHIVQFAHKQAGTGYEGAIGELVKTVSEEGGNFVEHYRTREGQWAGVASMLGEGLGALIHPSLGKLGGALFGAGGKAISRLLHTGRPIPILAPVSNGLISRHQMIEMAEIYHSNHGVRGNLNLIKSQQKPKHQYQQKQRRGVKNLSRQKRSGKKN